jgi:hypothetical protein
MRPTGYRSKFGTTAKVRRGADSLAALVREQLKHDPFSGTIFIFRSKRSDRLKILAWDGRVKGGGIYARGDHRRRVGRRDAGVKPSPRAEKQIAW